MAVVGGALVYIASKSVWPLAVPGAVLLAFAALGALRAVAAWDRTRVVVTPEEVVVMHGLLRRRSAVALLGGTGALKVDQSLLGRMLGYGTLVAGDLEIQYVPGARRLANTL